MNEMIDKILKYLKSPIRAYNDAGERIESMRFSVPALRVGVLEYGPGQLQTGNAALEGKPVKLYYPPEAVSDEKFLKSLETAPVVVGGHDSTTNEQNKKIDGWAHNVFFDAAARAAMIAGVVKGAKEVAYIKSNLGMSGFGASAFVDIYDLKVENGVTPDGHEYNAIANDLRATHVALAPHVRDPQNKIRVTNAVCINTEGEMMEVENAASDDKLAALTEKRLKLEKKFEKMKFDTSLGSDNSEYSKIKKEIQAIKDEMSTLAKNSRGEKFNSSEVHSMDPKEIAALVKNAVEEAIAEKNSDDRMAAMEETLSKHGDALNEINEKLGAGGANAAFDGNETAEEEKKEEQEGAPVENAKPSQEMVKTFSTALNVDFGSKTPSFATLAALAGIQETEPAARIVAVNAKFTELRNTPKDTVTAAAHNTVGEVF